MDINCSFDEKKTGQSLQMAEKLPESQQYANFRNGETFPTFASLPGDSYIDLAFYDTADGFSFMPRKHWCFLAEITDVEQLIRVKLTVRDKAGATLPVAFYPDGRGTVFAPWQQLRPGYTVAILYAHQHDFLDFTRGIRQEDDCAIRVRHPRDLEPATIRSSSDC